MTRPAIEVLLPFNKVDQYFLPAIKSVLASQEIVLRLILLDDRPDDSIPLPLLPAGQILIRRTSKRGYGNAISEGIRYVQAEYVGLMNADDLIHPKKFATQIRDLEIRNAELSVGKILKFDNSGRLTTSKLGNLTTTEYSADILLLGAYGADATWCIRTKTIKSWNFSNKLAADWITALENFSNTKVIYSSRAFYFYRQHQEQLTQSKIFLSSSFDDIYTAWKILNSKLGLPVLERESAILISAPWLVSTIPSDMSIRNAFVWLKLFDQKSKSKYKLQINRRYIYLLRKGFLVRVVLLGSFFPATLGVASYFFDKTLNIFRTIRFNRFLNFK